MMEFYRRKLPHFLPNDRPYFVTTCLADSLPKEVLTRLQLERDLALRKLANNATKEAEELRRQVHVRYFSKFDRYLVFESEYSGV